MNKTVICHFYNEEYLLPWWLNHHKHMFDHGIMINHHSDDTSVAIIQDLCPTWRIVNTRNLDFSAVDVDNEVVDYEKPLQGWRITLNVTEFLHGNLDNLFDTNEHQLIVPTHVMISQKWGDYPDISQPLHLYNPWGIPYGLRGRSIHNVSINYPVGRHFDNHTTDILFITKHKYSPFNDKTLNRALQIKDKIPQKDIQSGWGYQHLWSRQYRYDNWKNNLLPRSQNLSSLFKEKK